MQHLITSLILAISSICLFGFISYTSNKKTKPPLPYYWDTDFKGNKTIYTIFGEWIYFKAIEDGLKYAQYTPQNATWNPVSTPVDQEFEYSSGVRIGFAVQLPHNNVEIGWNWMNIGHNGNELSVFSSDYSVLTVLALPSYGVGSNAQAEQVNGRWKYTINATELTFKIPFHLIKWFSFSPFGGVKAGFVDQNIHASYASYLIVNPTVNSPQEIHAKNNMWGVGPMIGLDLRFLTPVRLNFFFSGTIAPLCSQFDLEAVYSNFTGNAPSSSTLTFVESQRRVSTVSVVQAGIEVNKLFKSKTKKRKAHKKEKDLAEFSLATGWEVQTWSKQFRLDLVDTLVEPSPGSDLTLYGPFLKVKIRF